MDSPQCATKSLDVGGSHPAMARTDTAHRYLAQPASREFEAFGQLARQRSAWDRNLRNARCRGDARDPKLTLDYAAESLHESLADLPKETPETRISGKTVTAHAHDTHAWMTHHHRWFLLLQFWSTCALALVGGRGVSRTSSSCPPLPVPCLGGASLFRRPMSILCAFSTPATRSRISSSLTASSGSSIVAGCFLFVKGFKLYRWTTKAVSIPRSIPAVTIKASFIFVTSPYHRTPVLVSGIIRGGWGEAIGGDSMAARRVFAHFFRRFSTHVTLWDTSGALRAHEVPRLVRSATGTPLRGHQHLPKHHEAAPAL